MFAGRTPPLVSVIIPTKDRCGLVQETIRSVQTQTYGRWEAVVVDDGSNDDTWPELQRLAQADPRIRPLRRSGLSGGPHVARNQGLDAARGEFIVFLDSDDLLSADALEYRVTMAQGHPEADLWVCGNEHFFAFPGDCGKETGYRAKLLEDVDALDAFLANYPAWYISSPLWRREALARIGPWNTQYCFCEDLEYNIRALVLGLRYQRFHKVDQFIRQHNGLRVGNNNKLSSLSSRIEILADLARLLDSHQMLTIRRRRLLALAALWGAVGDATAGGPRPRFKEVLPLWRTAMDRSHVGKLGYLIGCTILLSQWMGVLGVMVREASRLLFYNYLKRRPILHPGVLQIFMLRLRWKLVQRLGTAVPACDSNALKGEALR